MDPFERRKLGRSDLMVPVFGFGGAPLGGHGRVVPDEQADATLAAAWEEGVRFYDTSPWYGCGQSEHRLGRALYSRPRDEVILATKVGRVLRSGRDLDGRRIDRNGWLGGLEFDFHFDYSYDGVMRSYEDSLQRFGMTRIDALLIHDLDLRNHKVQARYEAHLGQLVTGGFRALADLKAAGLIKAIGAGVNDLGTIPQFTGLFDIDFFLVAKRYTLGEQRTLDGEDRLCSERGISMVVGSVFSTGLYAVGSGQGASYNYRRPTETEEEKARRIEAVCRRHGVPLATAALQFPLHNPVVAAIIPGAFHPDHIRANVKAMRHEIPVDLWRELKHEKLIRDDAPVPG
jgi:D-threo-aldose 1-dehydrogenase